MQTRSQEKDSLSLKWGTLKAWNFHSATAKELLREYHKIGSSLSAIMQHDTERQKQIICELIDLGDFDTVYLDWDGIEVTKSKAKKYVMEYGSK